MSDPYAPFPTIVYRCPGPHWGPPGTTYESVGVEDEQQLAQRLSDGWFATLPEAAESFLNPKPSAEAIVAEVVEDDAPPTRAEMEAKATELGIKFDGRTSDARLLAKITEALRAASDPI